MTFPASNLPTSSIIWGREVEKRITNLQTTVSTNERNNLARDAQILTAQTRLDKAVTDLQAADIAITAAQADANTAIANAAAAAASAQSAANTANAAIAALGQLDEPTSTYKLNASNLTLGTLNANLVSVTNLSANSITSGIIDANTVSVININANNITSGSISGDRITGGEITGTTIQTSSSTGVVLNNSTNSITFRVNGSPAGHLVPLNNFGVLMHYGSSPDGNGGTYPQVYVGSGIVALNASTNSGISTLTDGTISLCGSGSINGNFSVGGVLNRPAAAGTGTAYAYVNSNGDFFRGAATPSDERLKENISTTRLGTEFIKLINPVEFEFIDKSNPFNQGVQFGVIAQDLLQALNASGINGDNGLVYIPNIPEEEGGSDGYYIVNHEQLIAPMIKTIQELTARIELLEGK